MNAAAMAPRISKPTRTRIASSKDKPNSQSATSDDATEARTITPHFSCCMLWFLVSVGSVKAVS